MAPIKLKYNSTRVHGQPKNYKLYLTIDLILCIIVLRYNKFNTIQEELMLNLDTQPEELFMVVARTFSGQPPMVHKTLSDRFHLTPQEAWKIASKENDSVGAFFWTVVCFRGRLVAEFEDKSELQTWVEGQE